MAINLFVYFPAFDDDFLYYDDREQVLNNPMVQDLSWSGLKRMFQQTVMRMYIPLTTLSYALEHYFFGFDSTIFHFDNFILHVLNTGLVLVLASRLGLSALGSFLVALLFSLHPVKVESVVWITERKDVLYSLFYLLSLHFFLSYEDKKKIAFYWLSLSAGLLSLLAKPMALSLPLVILAVQYMRSGRVTRKMLLDKIPFFVFIIPITLVTYLSTYREVSFLTPASLLMVIWSFVFYLKIFVWPLEITPVFNPPANISLTNPEIFYSVCVLILYFILLWRIRKQPFLLGANAFFIFSIFFLLRADTAVDLNIVAARFLYLPSLGLCLLIGYGVDRMLVHLGRNWAKKVLIGILVSMVLILSALSRRLVYFWQDDMSLWTYASRRLPQNYFVHYTLGFLAYKDARYPEALAQFNESAKARPQWVPVYFHRALTYILLGQKILALQDLNKAIGLNDAFYSNYRYKEAEIFNERGLLLIESKQIKPAWQDFNQAIIKDSSSSHYYNNRGYAYELLGQIANAKKDYQQALNLDPKNAAAQGNLKAVE